MAAERVIYAWQKNLLSWHPINNRHNMLSKQNKIVENGDIRKNTFLFLDRCKCSVEGARPLDTLPAPSFSVKSKLIKASQAFQLVTWGKLQKQQQHVNSPEVLTDIDFFQRSEFVGSSLLAAHRLICLHQLQRIGQLTLLMTSAYRTYYNPISKSNPQMF